LLLGPEIVDGKTSAGEEEEKEEEEEEAFSGRPRNDRRPAIVLMKDICYLDFVTMLATALYTSCTLVVKMSSPLRARGCAIVRLTTR